MWKDALLPVQLHININLLVKDLFREWKFFQYEHFPACHTGTFEVCPFSMCERTI